MEKPLLNNLLTLSLFATDRLWAPPRTGYERRLITSFLEGNGPKEAATKTDKWWTEDAQLVCSLKRRLASVLATTKALGGLGCFLPNSFRCSSVGIVRLGTASHRTALKQDSITRVTKNSIGDPHDLGLLDPDPHPFVRGTDPDPALDPSSDPSLFT
jgi:hypothetical protein